jgi:hypothetical protein
MNTSRHGFTRCESCGAHVRAEDVRGEAGEQCRFCAAPATGSVARGGLLAASLFALSMSASACSSDPPPEEMPPPDNGGSVGGEEPTPVPAYGVAPEEQTPPEEAQQPPEDPPVVALYGVPPSE